MREEHRLAVLTVLVCLVVIPSSRAGEVPLAVADRACLFLDDHLISEQQSLTRTFHQGKPHPKAVINETEPWEHWICLWGSCFYDPQAKVYRMYYQSTLYPSGEPGISFRDYLMYAESKDGVEWVKPKLGLVEHNGSKDNNIVFAFAGPANVFLDPKATDPKGRIKAQTYFMKSDPRFPALDMTLLESADGINFTHVARIEKPEFAVAEQGNYVDGMVIGFDPLKERYIANFRCFSTHAIAEKKNGQRRACGITWSDSIHKGWSPTQLIVAPDEKDDARVATKLSKEADKPDWTELYMMPISVYGNHYLGFITLFDLVDGKDGNGGGAVEMAFSNDGLKWSRLGQGTSAIERSDDPELSPNFAQFNPLLDMGDEIWLFYSENNGVHGCQPFEKSRGRIRAAVWRKDGFVSMDASERGTLVTKPFVFDGKELLVNFKTENGGTLRVGLLDENSQPITQFNLGECQVMKGDNVAQKITWVGGSDISKFSGKPVRLMFEVTNAHLYSFRLAK